MVYNYVTKQVQKKKKHDHNYVTKQAPTKKRKEQFSDNLTLGRPSFHGPGSEFFDPETIREKEEKAIMGGGWPPKTKVHFSGKLR